MEQDLPPRKDFTAPAATQPAQTRKHRVWREFLSTALVFAIALLVAGGLISFVFQSYEVDGPSMETTLQNQDRLIVWKLPRTWARITHHQYVPQRGDIIVFVESGLSQYGQQDTKQLIKRVIGLPGDHVVVKDGKVTVYNSQHPTGFNPDTSLPYGAHNHIPSTSGTIDVTLSQDELFVNGDNRPVSLDSRTFGPIKTSQVVGKLMLRVYPLSKSGTF